MKIYTRTGDRGDTGLFGGQRVAKDHTRVDGYGEVDELNAVVGFAVVQLRADGEGEMAQRLQEIQADLFAIGANLATPGPEDGGRENSYIPEIPAERVPAMEGWIDDAEAELEPLRSFILPGGGEAAARLHLARTVCRRAERRVITLSREAHIAQEAIVYLNRLSDLLFTLARLANHRMGMGDVAWKGGAREQETRHRDTE